MATFINTREWRKEELRRAIAKVLENTDENNTKTASAIAEELRDILPYVVAVQSVTANIYYSERHLSNARIRRTRKGWFYLERKGV